MLYKFLNTWLAQSFFGMKSQKAILHDGVNVRKTDFTPYLCVLVKDILTTADILKWRCKQAKEHGCHLFIF